MSGQPLTNSEVLDTAVAEPTLGGLFSPNARVIGVARIGKVLVMKVLVWTKVWTSNATKIVVAVCHISRLSW